MRILVFLLFISIIACKPAVEKTVEVPAEPKRECYSFVNDKDTIMLNLTLLPDNKVEGALAYFLFEKDRNFGKINGEVKDDLIIAEYDYASEGKVSVRQVVFKKSEGKITEGFGEVVEEGGKFKYKDINALSFENGLVLMEGPCK